MSHYGYAPGLADNQLRGATRTTTNSVGSDPCQEELCAAVTIGETAEDMVEDCLIPQFSTSKSVLYELPANVVPALSPLVHEFKDLFQASPGATTLAQHYIPTSGTPVKIPAWRIPAHYHAQVEEQIHSMRDAGIIVESSSPWMVPAVFVCKKSGDIQLCIDY